MTTISVPINAKQERVIYSLVKAGVAANKAHAVRLAIDQYHEMKLLKDIIEAEKEIAEGKVLYGDPRKLLKKF